MIRNTHAERMLNSIKSELEVVLKNNLPSELKYPINFENDLGKFQLQENNHLLIQPKKGVEYLVLNIKILPSGTEFEDL